MLKNLKIQNFRGLSDLSLEGLGRFNVLLGANGVGKSTILESMLLLPGGGWTFTMATQLVRGFKTRFTPNAIYCFHALDVEQEISISAHTLGGGTKEYRLSSSRKAEKGIFAQQKSGNLVPNGSKLDKLRCNLGVKSPGGKFAEIAANIDVDEQGDIQIAEEGENIRGNRKSYDMEVIKDPFNPVYWNSIFRESALPLNEVIINGRKPDLLKAIQRIEPRLIDFTIIDDQNDKVYVGVGLRRMIPIKMLGGGVVSAFRILSDAFAKQSQVLLLDQLGDGLHLKAVRPLLEALIAASRDDNIQFFITTHDLEVLQAIREIAESDEFSNFQSEICCYHLGRGKDSVIRSYRYDYEQFEHCIRNAIEIR